MEARIIDEACPMKELGYALKTALSVQKGTDNPLDIGVFWKSRGWWNDFLFVCV